MKTLVSVVVPFHNEEENVGPLSAKIDEVFAGLPAYGHECLFVDDGSTDGTRKQRGRLSKANGHVRCVHMAERCGQSAAIVAGMRRTRGELILMVDGDLQNDPCDFPKMLTLLEEYDCVFGQRVRRNDPWLKRVAGKAANTIRRWWLDDGILDAGCGSKGFRRHCVEHMVPFNGMHRYFGVMMKVAGMRITEIEVTHHSRRFGHSKYGIWDRLGRGIYDLLGVAWLRRRYVPIRVEGED